MKSTRPTRPKTLSPAVLVQPDESATVQWEMQQIRLAITRRAFELFEARNREHGHDWEDWFQAESELLRPVSMAISESASRISIRANVLGFEANELNIALEPGKILILGRKVMSPPEGAAQTTPADFYPDQLMRIIDVAADVDPDGAVVELEAGILKFELPKIAKSQATASGA